MLVRGAIGAALRGNLALHWLHIVQRGYILSAGGCGDHLPWLEGAAMKRATAVRGVKIRATYDHVHAAWRAGAVKDFYYGTRSDTDDTVVWIVDGAEYGKTDHGAVTGAVDAALAAAGIATVAFGAQWCGYRALHVVHVDGAVTVDEYVTGEAVNDELEVAA